MFIKLLVVQVTANGLVIPGAGLELGYCIGDHILYISVLFPAEAFCEIAENLKKSGKKGKLSKVRQKGKGKM